MAAGGAPQWPAIEDAATLGQAVCVLAKAINKLTGSSDIDKKLDRLLAGQGNVSHRNWNGMSRDGNHELEPLMAEDGERVGQYPSQKPDGMFPKTYEELNALDNADLNALQTFYHHDFKGPSVAARLAKLKAFIGAQ